MTVPAPGNLYAEYVADGLATERSIGFPLRRPADLRVQVNGVLQVLGQHYAVTGVSPSQRIVPLAPFWPSGATIAYWRDTAREQEYDIPAGVDLRNESLEDELDRNQLQQQEQDQELARSLKVPRGEVAPRIGSLAGKPAGTVLEYDGDGTLVPKAAIETASAAAAAASAVVADTAADRSEAARDVAIAAGVQYPTEAAAVAAIADGAFASYLDADGNPVWGERDGSSMVPLPGPWIDADKIGFEQSGTGAVARTEGGKLRETVSADDYTTTQAALDARAAVKGGTVFLPAKTHEEAGTVTVRRWTSLRGEGCAHHAFYANPSMPQNGSVLLVTPDSGDSCVKFESNVRGYMGIEHCSIYADGTDPIEAVVDCRGILHPHLRDVEIACLGTARGIGLWLANEAATAPFSGQALTLYAILDNVVVTNVEKGLVIENDTNALTFTGGQFTGTDLSLEMTGTYARPLGISFNSTAFEAVYNTGMEHIYVADRSKILGLDATGPGYIVPFAKVTKGRDIVFNGCYFELGGVPATYSDGVSGTHPCHAVVVIGNGATVTDADSIKMLGCNFSGCYVIDDGVNTLIDNLNNGKKHDTTPRPLFLGRVSTSQTVVSFENVALNLAGALLSADTSWFSYNAGTGTITVNYSGTYRIHANALLEIVTADSTLTFLRVVAGGTEYRGPWQLAKAGASTGMEVDVVVSLSRGQTIQVSAFQTSGYDATVPATATSSYIMVHPV